MASLERLLWSCLLVSVAAAFAPACGRRTPLGAAPDGGAGAAGSDASTPAEGSRRGDAAGADVAAPTDTSPAVDGGPALDLAPDGGDAATPAEAGADASTDAQPHVCVPGTRRCLGTPAEVCDEAGTWRPDAAGFTCETPPSCQTPAARGITACGPHGESCCVNIEVPGGSFFRSYDGVSCPGGPNPDRAPSVGCYNRHTDPATVSSFRLDKYLVTVARFRRFVKAVLGGWAPSTGSGLHAHLAGGHGLADSSTPGHFESGWQSPWNAALFTDIGSWSEQLGTGTTWSEAPGPQDDLPLMGVRWEQAYAFCIWDRGFLPSEAEWNYAAAGGDEQRAYPWSIPSTSTTLDCAHVAYASDGDPANECLLDTPLPVGAKSPLGDAKWGHADMAGDASEFVMDWIDDYVSPCVDCADVAATPPMIDVLAAPGHVTRGSKDVGPTKGIGLLTSFRYATLIDEIDGGDGFRCARLPF